MATGGEMVVRKYLKLLFKVFMIYLAEGVIKHKRLVIKNDK